MPDYGKLHALLRQFEFGDNREDSGSWDFVDEFLTAAFFGDEEAIDEVYDEPSELMHSFGPALLFACPNRSLFITEKGQLGLGPDSIQKGDLIRHLCTSQVPYALRGKGKTSYSLVGECYIHGIMKSELLHNF